MKTFSLLFHVAIAFAAVSGQQAYLGPYAGQVAQYDQIAQQSNSASSASASASASASSSQDQNSVNNIVAGPMAGPVVGPVAGPIVAGSPYTAVDPRARTTYASDTIYSNKGEILIHRPAPIIVKRPPTRVLVNHPPLVVKPAPVVLHKPPPVVLRKVFVKQHPRPVKVEPVYVNVVKPPAEKYYVNEKSAAQAAIPYRPYQALPALPPPRTPCEAAARQQYAMQAGGALPVPY